MAVKAARQKRWSFTVQIQDEVMERLLRNQATVAELAHEQGIREFVLHRLRNVALEGMRQDLNWDVAEREIQHNQLSAAAGTSCPLAALGRGTRAIHQNLPVTGMRRKGQILTAFVAP